MTTSRETLGAQGELSAEETSRKGEELMTRTIQILATNPQFANAAATTFLKAIEATNANSFRPIPFRKEDSCFEVSTDIIPETKSLKIYRAWEPGRDPVLVDLTKIMRWYGFRRETFYRFSYYDDVEHSSNGITFTGYSVANGESNTLSAATKIEAVLEELEK